VGCDVASCIRGGEGLGPAGVTQIVREPDGAVNGLLDEFKKQPPANIASMQAEARLRLQDDLRRLEHETHGLRERIEAGHGLDETRSIYEHIGSAREEARKQMQAAPVQKRVDQAEALWARLTPYSVSRPASAARPQTTPRP